MQSKSKWPKVRSVVRAVARMKTLVLASHGTIFTGRRWLITGTESVRPTKEEETPELSEYLDEVWECCKGGRGVYDGVVAAFDKCKSSPSPDPNVIQELCSILSGFPFLIEKFATVLPGSSSLEVPKDFAMTRVVGIKREGEVLAWRAAFGVTSTCKSDELSPTDDKILCLLRSALATPEREDAVQTLRKEDARRTLDLMQKLLNDEPSWRSFVDRAQKDHQFTVGDAQRRRVRRLLVKLATASHQLPPSLYLGKGKILLEPTHYITGGSWSDIYSGKLITSSKNSASEDRTKFAVMNTSQYFDDTKVALKRVKVFTTLPKSDVRKLHEMLYEEALIWAQLRGQYIMPFLGVDRYIFGGTEAPLCMVMPWAENGNILQYIDSLKYEKRSVPMRRWLCQTAEGLISLHEKGVVHGDLRGANVLIDKSSNVRLADFGLSVLVKSATSTMANPLPDGGTTRFMAPELFLHMSHLNPSESVVNLFSAELSHLAPAVDIYAFACLCIELYSGRAPLFKGELQATRMADMVVSDRVIRDERPVRPEGQLPDDLWSLIEDCWKRSPGDRPTAKALLSRLEALPDLLLDSR